MTGESVDIEAWSRFTARLGFGDGISEPQATPDQMLDPIEQAFSDARDHQECPKFCELCGERLATTPCDRCGTSGCLPNAAMAYQECGDCAGVGFVHVGCVERTYVELADALAAATARAEAAEAREAALRAGARETCREWPDDGDRCDGDDRPHAPHRPCDMGCQPDWHRDGCAIYVRIRPDMPHTTATDDGATT